MRDAADEEDQLRGFRPEFIVAVERRGFVASLFEFAIGRLGVDGSFVIVEELRVLERVAG